MTKHSEPRPPSAGEQVILRGPAELADALPYLVGGFHPDDSVVMVAVHGDRGRFGARLRLGIPGDPAEWGAVSGQLARCLVSGSAERDGRPDGIIVFLCQDPGEGESAREVVERLRPLSQALRLACGGLDVPVLEALCVSGGRFWSYCCPDPRCCPEDGTPLALPGTSVMAAAAAYAGIRARGSLRELEAGFAPLTSPAAAGQESALDAAAAELVPRVLEEAGREAVRKETIALAGLLIDRLADGPPPPPDRVAADARDDAMLAHDEAAAVILGLQDRTTRDRAAEWMEGPEAGPALRLWRALARRCVGAYAEHAAAPLTLAGWVAWSTGDEPEARVALGLALRADPEYVFARLLHQGANEGVDPEVLRGCLRRERAARLAAAALEVRAGASVTGPGRGSRPAGRPRAGTGPSGTVRRRGGERRAGRTGGTGRS
ncbi:DUF4192 domain-containing protein [Streptomyces albus]|uniref:DUF4192 domain-containing protein n=1 Tax=Streptomyces albus TaxID=1888 RepID=UPI0004C66922|nr:DUF4192 domain-containing protein [Streptomyces albus]